MNCPFCLHKKTEIYNSRRTSKLNSVWRRRRCLACGRAFTTREQIDIGDILFVHKDSINRARKFSPTSLLLSLLKACDHRADIDTAVPYLASSIEQEVIQLASQQEGTVNTKDIITICGNILKRFDPMAYVKYLSYYDAPPADMRSLKKRLRK